MQPWDALPRLLGGAIFPTPSKSKLSNLPAQHMTTDSEPAVKAGFNAFEIRDQESFIGRTALFFFVACYLSGPLERQAFKTASATHDYKLRAGSDSRFQCL